MIERILTDGERYVVAGVATAIAVFMLSPRVWRRFKPTDKPDEKKGDFWYNVIIIFLFVLAALLFTGKIDQLLPLLEMAKDYLPGSE